ncbi:MAG: hypothetical protein LBH54_00625 [Clostridiales bacterium]|nr:hypothetical protein [Clostridiales bacterium]
MRETENIDYYKIIGKTSDIDVSRYGHDELVDDAVEREMTKIRFKEVILREPGKYLWWYTVGKTIENWSKPFFWTPLFGLAPAQLNGQHYLLLAAGIAGFAAFLSGGRGKESVRWMPAVSVAYFNTAHLPFYCFSRYMFPTVFCFALYAAYFFDKTALRMREQHLPSAGRRSV